MGIGVSWNQGVIRCGDNYIKYGDSFEYMMVVQIINDTAYLSAGVGVFKLTWYKDILFELYKYGIKKVFWTRIRKNGTYHTVSYEIERYLKDYINNEEIIEDDYNNKCRSCEEKSSGNCSCVMNNK